MKKINGLSFFILIFFGSSLFAQNNVDVLHYKFHIGLNGANDTIYGVAEIKLRSLQQVSSIILDLTSKNAQGKGMKVDTVVTILNEQLKFKQQGEKLNILLQTPLKINDTISFTLTYHGIPSDGLIISKNK